MLFFSKMLTFQNETENVVNEMEQKERKKYICLPQTVFTKRIKVSERFEEEKIYTEKLVSSL